jgi:hypothetical protein
VKLFPLFEPKGPFPVIKQVGEDTFANDLTENAVISNKSLVIIQFN